MKFAVQVEGNNGEIKIIHLPCSDLGEELEKIFGEEYDYDFNVDEYKVIEDDLKDYVIDYDILFHNCDTIEEFDAKLIELVEMVDGVEDLDDVVAVMNCGGYNFFDALEKVYNNNVMIYRGVYSKEDFTRDYVQDMGGWCGIEIPHNSSLWWYLDYEKMADEIFMGDMTYDDDTQRVVDFNY